MGLYRILQEAVGSGHTVAGDAFVYWNAADPRRCLAPDGFVKLGGPPAITFESYKTWELGTPELAIEITSPSDTPERWTFQEKLGRYHELGVAELISFQADAPVGARLRAWDRLEGDLVERVVENERTPCLTLGMTFVIAPLPDAAAGLRLATDEEGEALVLLPEERATREREELAARGAEAARELQTAEARIAALEAENARLRGERT